MTERTHPTVLSERQIVGLDLIRFSAAILVVLHHLGWRVWAENYAVPMNYTYLEPLARAGFIGVEIFFVLSGFVIAYSASNATPRSFALSRALRLYPAAWGCATITVVAALIAGRRHLLLGGVPVDEHLLKRWISSVTLYPFGTWVAGAYTWVDGAYWTLREEIGFYIMVFLLLLWNRFRWIEPWMAILGVISVIGLILQANLASLWHTSPALAYYAFHMELPWYMIWLSHHGCFFGIGVYLWLCFYDRFTKGRVAWIGIMLIGVLCDVRLRTGWHGLWRLPLLLWSVAMLAMVASIRYNAQIRAVLGVRGATIARRLGLVTYPLYLLHQVVGYALLAEFKGHLPDLLNLLVSATIIFALAFAVNVFFEAPVQRWLRHLTGDRRLPTVPATTAP